MNFKEQLEKDIKTTFFNLEEFGEAAVINGRDMTVIMDSEELQQQNLAIAEKLSRGVLLFHVESSCFEHMPQAEKLMKFNNETYRIDDVKEHEKVLTITLGRYSG